MGNLNKNNRVLNDSKGESEVLAEVESADSYSESNDKRKYAFLSGACKSIVACLIGIAVAGGSIYFYNQKKEAYNVKYNGKFLGYVKHKEEALAALEEAKEEIKRYDPSINVGQDFQVVKILSNAKNYTTKDQIENYISSGIMKEYTSYAIVVNGKEMAIVDTEDTANKVIEDTKEFFASKEEKNESRVLEVKLTDDIQIVKKVVDGSKLCDAKKALDTLTASIGTTKQYTISDGETLWTISKNTGMKINDIVALNPGLNADKIHIGQVLNLTVSKPVLNVEVKLRLTSNESVAYSTKYTEDKSIYKGKTKVVTKGQYGVNKVMTDVTKVNGVITEKKDAGKQVVKEPVTEVVAKGGKQLPVVASIFSGGGSGIFGWPIKGSVSSGFGSRGGEFHKGLDIRAPQGTSIYAAAAGTVTHAGWYNGYGNLVIIKHGNGYETYYGHCSSISVKVGQSVKKGQYIAAVGHTGDATGNHVHFEVRKNGSPQNPSNYLK